jgi:membrane-bound metal-dependent hydrolase YbcI (DUF457 family)
MMGSSHAATGAAAWLAGCATASVLGYDPSIYQVVVGTPLCAFGAIFPDIDCPSSSVARSLGWPTRVLARMVAGFGRWLHDATRTRLDSPDRDGHRTFTHTVVFAVLTFLGFGWLGQHGGLWAPLAMTVFAAATALRAVKVRGPKRYALAAAVGVAAWYWPAPDGWWLGWAIGGGALVHNLGDRMTNTGVPLLWPIKIRGKRWYKFRAARWVRFETGADGNPERAIRSDCAVVCVLALLVMAYFRWPPFAAGVDGGLAAIAAALSS